MAIRRTIASYDEIAGDYRKRWHDRTVLERAMAAFVRRVRPDGLVVDVGCGPGFDAALLRAEGLRTVQLDLSRGMMTVGRQHYGGAFVQADMRRLPLGEGAADGLWVSASLVHLPKVEARMALSGFFRVLGAGGILYLSVKEGTGSEWRREAYGQRAPRYFAYWQAAELDRALQEAGFDVVEGWRDESASIWLVRIVAK